MLTPKNSGDNLNIAVLIMLNPSSSQTVEPTCRATEKDKTPLYLEDIQSIQNSFSLTEDKENKFSLNPLMSTDNALVLNIDWEKRNQVCQAQDNWPTAFIDALLVLQWVMSLRWPHGEPVCPENDISTSLRTRRTLASTLIPGTKKCGVAARYASKHNPLVYHVSPTLGRDISTFAICFKMPVRKGVIAMPFAYCTKALSARRLGFSAVKPGIASRPSLVGGLNATRWFQNTLTAQGKHGTICPLR